MTIGERIKNRRKELGISAEKLAADIGVSAATIYRYENGDIEKMNSKKLKPIAEVLRTTPADLMGWDSNEKKDVVMEEVMNLLANVPSEKMDQVKDYLRFLSSNL